MHAAVQDGAGTAAGDVEGEEGGGIELNSDSVVNSDVPGARGSKSPL